MVTAAGAGRAMAVGVGRLISSDSIPVGGLTPGSMLADRYRIIGLLGRGGMGEVYRADDLKLGQPVALKFLPKTLSSDPVRRERFFAEVRITRQLAHPNICRVYDIGDVASVEAGLQTRLHFLSMEYIDGEDLASLKRIGYLSNEKALDIARQLVAGLAAAHERGVLHRDLKPANIMIDGRGRVRITDFGLAVAEGEETPAGDVSGTPAYMAPEQWTPLIVGPIEVVCTTLELVGLMRFGLVAMMVSRFVVGRLETVPTTFLSGIGLVLEQRLRGAARRRRDRDLRLPDVAWRQAASGHRRQLTFCASA